MSDKMEASIEDKKPSELLRESVQRITTLEEKFEEHQKTAKNTNKEVGEMRLEMTELLAIMKATRGLVMIIHSVGHAAKWFGIVGMAIIVIWDLIIGIKTGKLPNIVSE